MKKLLIGLLVFGSFSSFAYTKFCGKLTSLSFQTDIYSVVRMGLINESNKMVYLTVKDERAVESTIAVVSNTQNYQHKSDMDDYVWTAESDNNNYFICVTGAEIRTHRDKFYMDKVEEIVHWENGKRI